MHRAGIPCRFQARGLRCELDARYWILVLSSRREHRASRIKDQEAKIKNPLISTDKGVFAAFVLSGQQSNRRESPPARGQACPCGGRGRRAEIEVSPPEVRRIKKLSVLSGYGSALRRDECALSGKTGGRGINQGTNLKYW